MDYSKFDSIVDSDDDTPSAAEQPRVQFPYAPPPKVPHPALVPLIVGAATTAARDGRSARTRHAAGVPSSAAEWR